MKKLFAILTLALALALCACALAEETAPAEPAVPTEVKTDEAAEQEAMEQALDAYRELKGAAKVKNLDTLKKELDAYVADGKLTQEQADLILRHYTERFASRGEKGGRKQENTAQRPERQKKQKNDQQQEIKIPEQQPNRQKPDGQRENRRQNKEAQPETQNAGGATPGADAATGATKTGE